MGAMRAGGDEAARKLKANFTAAMEKMNFPKPGAAIAGYQAMGSEIDPEPLLSHLRELGYVLGLPAVAEPDSALTFRAPGRGLTPLTPRAVLCPLLAFDERGVRLGQGGGHYDRTLMALRKAGALLAVGLAFDIQRMAEIPREDHDQRLDWVITEETAYRCGARP